MTRKARMRRELKELRRDCIEGTQDLVLKRIAYEIESAVRYVIEDGIKDWPSLAEQAHISAKLLKDELAARAPQEKT